MNGKTLRYEYKYVIGAQSAELLRRQLGALLRTDEHADRDGRYFVRSVYFDDDALTAYYDKLAGVAVRSKYRLRFYNMNPDYLVFEAKRKRGQLVSKSAVPVSRAVAERMLAGRRPEGAELTEPLLAEFDTLTRIGGMRPRVIVDYERTAFVHPAGDTRVTLDRDIRAEVFRLDNVFVRRAAVPAMEDGTAVLEVKFCGQPPPFLLRLLSGVPEALTANSKYCNCMAVYF